MRRIPALALLCIGTSPLAGQETVPSNLVGIELERSRTCADVLTRLEALDTELEPLATRAQRLMAIAGAINVEEASVVDSLNTADPVESAVREWFESDAALAERYLEQQSQAILDERAEGRRAILEAVSRAVEDVQATADSVMQPTGTLTDDGVACAGVILVRDATAEACNGLTSRVCEAARDTSVQAPFQFVDDPELLWFSQELRPWTSPGPLGLSPQGQLSGARTIGTTRVGNLGVSVSLSPLLRARTELSPDELAVFDSINVPLGIESTHPDLVFVPALSLQANLPQSIGGETRYLLHFGSPAEPDALWLAEADTGAPIAGTVALAPAHVARLAEGHAMAITAIRDVGDGESEAVFSLGLTTVNQAAPVRTLLSYMVQQLPADLERLVPPQNP